MFALRCLTPPDWFSLRQDDVPADYIDWRMSFHSRAWFILQLEALVAQGKRLSAKQKNVLRELVAACKAYG